MNIYAEWNAYKQAVKGSREVMIWPWLNSIKQYLLQAGVDLGCGDGEYTHRISELTGARMVGIDMDPSLIALAQKSNGNLTSYVQGDVTCELARESCRQANFVVSICCLTHLNDDECKLLFANLQADLKSQKYVAILLTHQRWAEKFYGNIERVASGIKADPRYGTRQWFRDPDWYTSAFQDCDFTLQEKQDLIIPDDIRLEPRYIEMIGFPLFETYVFSGEMNE